MAQAKHDENHVPTLLAVSNADGVTPVALWADPVTHRLLVDLPASGSTLAGLSDVAITNPQNAQVLTYDTATGKWINSNATSGGTVTSVSVSSANGFAGTVATATTTPAITLSTSVTGLIKGNGTALSAATADVDYLTPTTAGTTYFKLNQVSPQTVTGTPQFPSLGIIGTAGAGFVSLVGQSSNPSSPSAGTALLHSKTVNGFTRIEQDNEATTNIVFGRDNVFVCRNDTGGTILKGQAVYTSGTASGVPQITKARANSSSTLPAIGIAADDITTGSFGQVMMYGVLSFDTTVFSDGNTVWVSTATAGSLQSTRPSGTTNLVQRMGTILVSGVAGTGLMLVETAPAILNMETGTNAATWTGSAIVGTTITTSGNIELGNASDTTLARVSAGVVSIEGNNVVVNTSSPTLATLTTTGNIELGHASDTTISRVSAGVISVEGVTVPTISSTNTLTNKRITKRIGTTTSSATPTINTDNVDFYSLTAQAVDITSFTTNLSGTPTEGQLLWIAITGTAARAITWGTSFEASTVALPTTTVTTARLDVGFVWNTVTSKWRCIASA